MFFSREVGQFIFDMCTFVRILSLCTFVCFGETRLCESRWRVLSAREWLSRFVLILVGLKFSVVIVQNKLERIVFFKEIIWCGKSQYFRRCEYATFARWKSLKQLSIPRTVPNSLTKHQNHEYASLILVL